MECLGDKEKLIFQEWFQKKDHKVIKTVIREVQQFMMCNPYQNVFKSAHMELYSISEKTGVVTKPIVKMERKDFFRQVLLSVLSDDSDTSIKGLIPKSIQKIRQHKNQGVPSLRCP